MATCRVSLLLLLSYCNPLLCQQLPPPAYHIAADKHRIPALVLYAVALQESGRLYQNRLKPWPWTLNIAGQSHWFHTRQAACSALKKALKTTPTKRIDVGLGQLNIGYMGQYVKQPCDLLEPYTNLDIAALTLKQHYQVSHDWLIAIGRYHRPAGGQPAIRYRQKVKQHIAQLREMDINHNAVLEFE